VASCWFENRHVVEVMSFVWVHRLRWCCVSGVQVRFLALLLPLRLTVSGIVRPHTSPKFDYC